MEENHREGKPIVGCNANIRRRNWRYDYANFWKPHTDTGSVCAHCWNNWINFYPPNCLHCLCEELITLPEESYRLWCVVVCDLETSRMRRPWPALGRSATGGKKLSTLAVGPTRYLVLGYRMSYCRDNAAEVWRWPFQLSLISILKRNRSVPPFPIYLYGLFFY